MGPWIWLFDYSSYSSRCAPRLLATVEGNIVASQAVERMSWVRVSEIERETCNNNEDGGGGGAGLLNLSLGLLHVPEF